MATAHTIPIDTVAHEIRRMWVCAGAYTNISCTAAVRADMEALVKNLAVVNRLAPDAAARFLGFVKTGEW